MRRSGSRPFLGAEFIDNPEHTTPALASALVSTIVDRYPAVGFLVLNHARIVHQWLIVDERGRAYKETVPEYIQDNLERDGVAPSDRLQQTEVAYDGERQVSGDTYLIGVGAPHISHFFYEGLTHLAQIPERDRSLLFLIKPLDAFVELMRLAGHDTSQVLHRPFAVANERPQHGGECWHFDRLIVPFYTARICPVHLPLFWKITQAVAPSNQDLLYITRIDARNCRVMLNEEDVIDLLSRKGFAIVNCSQMSEAQKIALFRGARVIVQPTGAGMFNSLFSDDLQFQLGLSAGSYDSSPLRVAAGLRVFRYGYFLGPEFLSYTEAQHKGRHNDYVLDLQKLERRIDRLLSP